MSKHNYSQYSNKKNNKVDAAPEVAVELQNGESAIITEEVETVVETTVEAEPAVEVAPETESTTETDSGAVATGVVANCAKLNVRSKPEVSADVVTVLNADDKISIDVDKSTKEWFKIRTADGVKGYCMRKFVNADF